MEYIGEHLLPGQLGRMAIALSFVAGLFAAISYFFATQRRDTTETANWLRLGRIGFTIHGISVFTVIGCIFYAMANHYFEYQYVQLHVSADLDQRYILSAFWEGQEGSFLLWMFWHVVLGMILMWKAGKWEAPTLAVLALIQVFIGSMILGVYVTETTKIGSNPMLLLRDVMNIPIFKNADYVSLIKGNGLNPLLQNYWMTIHPPTLFLGFASTSIPFCFAIAGLWTGEHKAWLKAAMPWALFSGAILGTGILMGGAWAYEALNFGGYWAWDPVENMSLVPWIILLAGIHTNLIARNTGHSIRATYLFYILTFVFILYSTFLTRSGILGDTSVHAFTEMGLENQLLLFIGTFLGLGLFLLIKNIKKIPQPEKEESISSKEFWLFIGTLVLLFSAGMISAASSLPIFNKIVEIFNPAHEPIVILDPVTYYNNQQLWVGILVGLMTGGVQFFRWKEQDWSKNTRKFWLHNGITIGLSIVLTILAAQWIDANAWKYKVLLFSGIYAVIANLDYLISFVRHNLKASGSIVSHLGFGLMLVGVMASGLNKQNISTNKFAQQGMLSQEMLERNVLLYKDMPMYFNKTMFKNESGEQEFYFKYRVTYESDTLEVNNRVYTIFYEEMGKNGEVLDDFRVHPTVLYDNKITKVAAYNPDTKHYLGKDIFTHIATIDQREADMEYRQNFEDTLTYMRINALPDSNFVIKDTVRSKTGPVILTHTATVEEVTNSPTHPDYEAEEGDLLIGAKIRVVPNSKDSFFYANPMLVLRGNMVYTFPTQINELGTRIRLHSDVFEQYFTSEQALDYQPITLKNGETKVVNNMEVTFTDVVREPTHPDYIPEEKDLAVGAAIKVRDLTTNEEAILQPIYLIRDSRPFILKDQNMNMGVHLRFAAINPNTETFDFQIARKADSNKPINVPLEVSTGSYRTDYVVLEAIVFPGINFFWAGCIMMMAGLSMGMFHRANQR